MVDQPIEKLAHSLDSRKFKVPVVSILWKEKKLREKTFVDVLLKMNDEENDEELRSKFEAFATELLKARNQDLWNAYVESGGILEMGMIKRDDVHYLSKVVRSKKTGQKYLKKRIAIDSTRIDAADGYFSLYHELGHWLDDTNFASDNAVGTYNKVGFHTESEVWKMLSDLDRKIYPAGEIVQTEKEIRWSGYTSDYPKFGHEIFAQTVSHHAGPRVKETVMYTRVVDAETERKSYGNLAIPVILSPLIQTYMDRIVGLDIAINLQDKSEIEKEQARKMLFAALRKPLQTYFDVSELGAQQEKIEKAESKAAKQEATSALETMVDNGLKKLANEVTGQLGITVSPLKRGRRKA